MIVNIFVWGAAMRVSRDQARANRERVVSASSALFREHGMEQVPIGDLMREAGLTHGGFYKQFASKAELLEEACARALDDTLSFWDTYLEGATDARRAFIAAYLSPEHRDEVAEGCLLPALAAEARRQPQGVREVFTGGINQYAERLRPPGTQTPAAMHQALCALSQMVGAVLLARVTTDPELSETILQAAREALLASPAGNDGTAT